MTETPAFVAARRVLAALDAALRGAVARVATACARDGVLDSARLDAQQWVCYELALVAADLSAARTLLDAADGGPALDAELAELFACDAAVAVTTRLQGIHTAIGLDPAPLHALAAGDDVLALRRAAGPDALSRIGAAVAAADGDVAGVPLDEQAALAYETLRRFAADVVAPMAEAIHRHDLTVPESLLQPLRELGVFGLSIPERYGGHAPDGRDNTPMMIAVTEALSEASLAAAGSLITRPEILARALLAGGTEAQKQHWLPKLAAGDPLCAIAITEPDYGSDVAGLALRATPADGGWLVNGAKTWCTFAGMAGVLMVVTRTDPDRAAGHRGLSLLLVEKPAYDGHEFAFVQPGGGRLTGRAIPTIGYRGMHSFDLAFEDFFVPGANVIGEAGGLGRGFYLTMAGMVGGRIQTAGRALGVMGAALKAAIRYAQDRRVFGAPLADYPLTQAKLATMAARYAACRHFAYAVGRMLDAGGGVMEASLAKLLACRTAEWVTREAMQIHGGMGYAEESAVSRYFVDARVLSIFEGAEETLALKVIAKSLLEEALRA
ncbi:MAG: acyl-CoA dehydrogenase family protein [Burkholderiales bacterium]